jgi:hypothetical protein
LALVADNANLFEIRMSCPGSGNIATITHNLTRMPSPRAQVNPRTVKTRLPGLGEPVLMDLPFVSKIVRGFAVIVSGALWKE